MLWYFNRNVFHWRNWNKKCPLQNGDHLSRPKYAKYLLVCRILPKGATVRSPDSNVHGANMGPTWVLSAPDGPHVGPGTLLSGSPRLAISGRITWANETRWSFTHGKNWLHLVKINMVGILKVCSMQMFLCVCKYTNYVKKEMWARWNWIGQIQSHRAESFVTSIDICKCY